MLLQNYESDPVSYEPIGSDGDAWNQNQWLSEAPREFEEAISRNGVYEIITLPGFFVSPFPAGRGSACSYVVVLLVMSRSETGGTIWFQRFDSQTGEFLEKELGGGLAYVTLNYTSLGRAGEVWARATLGSIQQLDPLKFTFGEELPLQPADFSPPHLGTYFVIDTLADRYVGSETGGRISVYELSTGTLLHYVDVGTEVVGLTLESERHCYVICRAELVFLVDYVEGRVIGSHRLVHTPNADTEGREGQRAYAFDPYSRRLLVFEHELDTAETGAPNSRIRGYYPLPVAARLTPPIPLSPPRAGRTIRLATRAVGTTGEGVAGVSVTAEATGTATLRNARAGTDGYGYAFHVLTCDDAGSATIEVEATVTESTL